ncbi:DNA methyltransferase [Methanococcus aeolicus]|uniref:DNA methyltransferase n=1 Tax=Methanococcus aeolicus TaxID=42879 RepID=UPI0021CA4F65|nr:DNA methyltransferase [Methanococcus aeolicus]UXM84075.1 N-6 DNA methylase [Methanococcus aeolicus]
MNKKLTKSRTRIRDHGEVFTPDFIVENMLNLVKHETERIDSRFLEPACGHGNFLIKVLERKLDAVERKYKKNQFDYERNSLIAISSIYGIELLDDNVQEARKRLYDFFLEKYKKLYKNKINQLLLDNIKFILERNIVQGDALTFKDKNGKAIIFPEWSAINGIQMQRRDFQFGDLAEFNPKQPTLFAMDVSDDGKVVFSPQPIKEYPVTNFLKLMEQENVK